MKKNIAIALGILGVAIIGGGAYLYATRKPKEDENPVVVNPVATTNTNSTIGTSTNSTIVKPTSTSTLVSIGNTIETNGSNVNIRSSASVNGTIITKLTGIVGIITAHIVGTDGAYWYKVKLATPYLAPFPSTSPAITVGYIRSDLAKKYSLPNYINL